MDHELTYEIPFERFRKLCRSMDRKAFSGIWWRQWALIGGCMAVLIGFLIFAEWLNRWFAEQGVPFGVEMLLYGSCLLFIIGAYWLRRSAIRTIKERADFPQMIRLQKDDGGVRIATDRIEYYLKWPGISQMLMEQDGVVISHGNLFFLIPDKAFEDKTERRSFIRDIYGRLSNDARKLSEKHIAPVLGYV